MANHSYWMQQALAQATQAQALGEVPIGAVVVYQDTVIAAGHNRVIVDNDPTAHAEVVALRHAAKHLNNYRLLECTLYVTLEPCPMCAGALLHSRVKRVVYGAFDLRMGAVNSQLTLLNHHAMNHSVQVIAGVMQAECEGLLKQFFQQKRADKGRSK